jgi:succinate dehydrogenase hydrophobic anchor subunit
MLYYYNYIKNLIENQIDNFFANILLEKEDMEIGVFFNFLELKDLLQYFFSFRFEEFFFHLKRLFWEFNRRNSYSFYFMFLITDFFTSIVFFLLSHGWISLKIYEDYIHNTFRRKNLKILGIFLFVYLLIFFVFFIFLI